MAVRQPVSIARPSFVFFTLNLVLMPAFACRVTPAKALRGDAVATAPSAARRPVSVVRAAAAESAATEPTGATTVAATASTAAEGANPGPSAEAQAVASPEASPQEDVPESAPEGDAAGAGESAWSIPCMVLVINDNLYRLIFVLSSMCRLSFSLCQDHLLIKAKLDCLHWLESRSR